MTDVLVVNHGLHQVCGIHDLGKRLHDAIPDTISKAYAEPLNASGFNEELWHHAPAVVIINYRVDLMPWVSDALRHCQGSHRFVAVAHNYEPHSLEQHAAMNRWAGFDVTLALEPEITAIDHVVWSGRPLPPPLRAVTSDGAPVIGSFGFAFVHKRFDLVAREIAALERPATFRLHSPTAHFGGSPEQTEAVLASVRAELDGSMARLDVSTDHRPALGVVRLFAANDVNCLLYDPGQPDAGLSSALDYLLAAGRPILVSEASMFRHARPAALTWPATRLADVLADADQHARNVQERYDELSQGYADGIERLLDMA